MAEPVGVCKGCGGETRPLRESNLAALGPATFCHSCAAGRFMAQLAKDRQPHALRRIIRAEMATTVRENLPIDESFWHVLVADAMCAALYAPEWAVVVLDIETVNESVAEMIQTRGARFTTDHPVQEAT